jgi:hypothetical protein
MRRYYLMRLRIEGFRGINDDGAPLDLLFATDRVNSIYAVNDLGKSSIYDALSYVIRGVIPKLEALQQSENASEYHCNRFHPPAHQCSQNISDQFLASAALPWHARLLTSCWPGVAIAAKS